MGWPHALTSSINGWDVGPTDSKLHAQCRTEFVDYLLFHSLSQPTKTQERSAKSWPNVTHKWRTRVLTNTSVAQRSDKDSSSPGWVPSPFHDHLCILTSRQLGLQHGQHTREFCCSSGVLAGLLYCQCDRIATNKNGCFMFALDADINDTRSQLLLLSELKLDFDFEWELSWKRSPVVKRIPIEAI